MIKNKQSKFVIKVGSNLLINSAAQIDKELIRWLARGVQELKKNGISATIVTSGAIGVGRIARGDIKNRPTKLRYKQALSAIGQPLLMAVYQEIFSHHGLTTAQVLLTKDDFNERERFLNIRDTILTLLEMDVTPIINENDTVATDEIKFGDNDNLSALVAAKIGADVLIILTDVEGLYRGEFKKENLITTVEKITTQIESLATKKSGSSFGTGGMFTKIQAAKIATTSGVKTILTRPLKNLFERIIEGKSVGTTFLPSCHMETKKCWIAFGAKPSGVIFIDSGAATAITTGGKSLLASGIKKVTGNFKPGDVIKICDVESGSEIARGLTYYSSDDLDKIKGRHSKDIPHILENAEYDEVVHRDNMVIL